MERKPLWKEVPPRAKEPDEEIKQSCEVLASWQRGPSFALLLDVSSSAAGGLHLGWAGTSPTAGTLDVSLDHPTCGQEASEGARAHTHT